MNIVKVMGGLGNQLFQYAFGRAQMQNGIDVQYNIVWYEVSHKRTQFPRPYRLPQFQINIETIKNKRASTLRENGFDINLLKLDNYHFHGYWQYLPYYENILDILRKELCVREEFYTEEFLKIREQIKKTTSVAVHVRKGDYVGNKGLHDLPFSYYVKALQLVEGDVYIFSDDIGWCKDKFKSEYFSRKITFVHLQEYLDFELMKLCSHQIMSASTFSWWAAILNNNPDKTVVAPIGWISGVDQEEELHYPKEWRKL